MSVTQQLPAPLDLIDEVIKVKVVKRELHLKAYTAMSAWYGSLGLTRWSIGLGAEMERTMKFVDYKLSKDEMEGAQTWMKPGSSELSELVNATLLEGYRITFSYDRENSAVIVTLIGKEATLPNHQLAMSTRHSSVAKALHLCMYKHHVVYQSGSWQDSDSTNMFG